MKRELESDACVPDLTDDILLEIARSSEWLLSCRMARLSKHLLRLFTGKEVLGEIVASIIKSDRIMFRWLTLALPDTLIGSCIVAKPVAKASIIELDRPGFVSGGAVCRMVYERQWDSDIDIWVHWSATEAEERGNGGDSRRFPVIRMLDINKGGDDANAVLFDVVYHLREQPERCIENFDLSIVQQGYFQSDSTEAYSTALALYSRQHSRILALPSRECIDYTGALSARYVVDIWYFIDKHCKEHGGTPSTYHACDQCDADESRGHIYFRRWRNRMKEYVKRFPDFPVTYCRTAPDTSQPVVIVEWQ